MKKTNWKTIIWTVIAFIVVEFLYFTALWGSGFTERWFVIVSMAVYAIIFIAIVRIAFKDGS